MMKFRKFPYYVSNKGEVFREGKDKALKPDINARGYKRVTLCVGGITKRFLIHRMVAELYIPNPNSYPDVNHIDNDPSNNDVSNLEWCTHSMNMIHCHSQNRCSNLKASNKALELADAAFDKKFRDIHGDLYIGKIYKNNRKHIHVMCLHCSEPFTYRSDHKFKRASKYHFCKVCFKDEDIVYSYMKV